MSTLINQFEAAHRSGFDLRERSPILLRDAGHALEAAGNALWVACMMQRHRKDWYEITGWNRALRVPLMAGLRKESRRAVSYASRAIVMLALAARQSAPRN